MTRVVQEKGFMELGAGGNKRILQYFTMLSDKFVQYGIIVGDGGVGPTVIPGNYLKFHR
jgi:hypothetical protein